VVGIKQWALGVSLGYLGIDGVLDYLGIRGVGMELLRAVEVQKWAVRKKHGTQDREEGRQDGARSR
jgi:hypothetical protein